MARTASKRRPAAPAAPAGEQNPKAPCACGSGRKYKHCHGSAYAPGFQPIYVDRLVGEKTTAAYVQADLAGDSWSADAGVRLVHTKTTAQAWDAKINLLARLYIAEASTTVEDGSRLRVDFNYAF